MMLEVGRGDEFVGIAIRQFSDSDRLLFLFFLLIVLFVLHLLLGTFFVPKFIYLLLYQSILFVLEY